MRFFKRREYDLKEGDPGTCGMPYLGDNKHLRGLTCVQYAGHPPGSCHKASNGRFWGDM